MRSAITPDGLVSATIRYVDALDWHTTTGTVDLRFHDKRDDEPVHAMLAAAREPALARRFAVPAHPEATQWIESRLLGITLLATGANDVLSGEVRHLTGESPRPRRHRWRRRPAHAP